MAQNKFIKYRATGDAIDIIIADDKYLFPRGNRFLDTLNRPGHIGKRQRRRKMIDIGIQKFFDIVASG